MFSPTDTAVWSHSVERDWKTRTITPATPLEVHAQVVAERIRELGHQGDAELLRVIGLIHDFGKLTTYFQRHIRGETLTPKELTYHARLGALAVEYALRNSTHSISHAERLLAVIAILKHHQSLPNLQSFAGQFSDDETPAYDKMEDKLDTIDTNNAGVADSLLNAATDGNGSWDEFYTEVTDSGSRTWFAVLAQKATAIAGRESEFYGRLLDLWTTLTLADTTDAAGIPASALDALALRSEAVPQHLDEMTAFGPSTVLNTIRDEGRRCAMSRIDAFLASGTNAGRITLPTGFGKTLTSTQVGLSIAAQKSEQVGRTVRLVYALPYTSIIDQTEAVLNDVFPEATTRHLATHHYLTDTSPDETEYEADALADDDLDLLFRSWRQQFTLTTFVQLFETLTGPSKSQGLKLPALRDAVIILDEPQTLPPEWMNLINRLCKILIDRYNAHVVSMTATQPKLFDAFEYTDAPFSLVESDDTAFSYQTPLEFIQSNPRVVYEIHPSADATTNDDPLAAPVAARDLIDSLQTGSTLAVCNTIESAQTLTQSVHGQMGGAQDLNDTYHAYTVANSPPIESGSFIDSELTLNEPIVAHLTTRHHPESRLDLLNIVSELCERGASVLLVSTQLVEAGVDISFQSLYRDLAPVPSLVQAAGRCNRNFRGASSTVTIWKLASLTGTSAPSESIYSRLAFGDPLQATEDTLTQYADSSNCIAEQAMVSDVVDTYYRTYHTTAGTSRTTLPTLVDDVKAADLKHQHLIDQETAVDALLPSSWKLFRELTDTSTSAPKRIGQFREFPHRTVSIPDYDSNQSLVSEIERNGAEVGDDTGLYVLPPDTGLYNQTYGLTD